MYIPDSAKAAGAARYDVYDRPEAPFADRVGTVIIDQAVHRGQWVTLGPYAFHTGIADLSLTDRGATRAPVAASAVTITCS